MEKLLIIIAFWKQSKFIYFLTSLEESSVEKWFPFEYLDTSLVAHVQFSFSFRTKKTRWKEAFNPKVSTSSSDIEGEAIYEEWGELIFIIGLCTPCFLRYME